MKDTTPMSVEVETEAGDLVPENIIKTEANLANFPFFALSRKAAHKITSMEYRMTAVRDEKRFEALWKVSANVDYGYPGPFDRRVHKAVEYIITQGGVPVKNPILFSTYQILRLLDLSDVGKNYREVNESLRRIRATNIESRGTFYDKGRKQYVSDNFAIYDRVVFRGEVDHQTGMVAECNLLYLGSWYLASINAHYVRPLDFQYLKSLRRDVASRLYELLGLKFYGVLSNRRRYWRVTYQEISDLLPITTQSYYSQARQNLDPVHQELIETGFLTKVDWDQESKSTWHIKYYPGKRARDEFARTQQSVVPEQLNLSLRPKKGRNGADEEGEGRPAARSRPLKPQNDTTEVEAGESASRGKNGADRKPSGAEQDLVERLKAYGVAENQKTGPQELIRDFGAEEVAKRLAACEFLVGQGKEALSAKLIVDSLKKGWLPDAYYDLEAEQEKRAEKEARERILAAEYQKRVEEARAEVEAWGSLPPDKRISFGFLDLWETNFRRSKNRNPTAGEREAKIAGMVANLPTPEQRLEQELRDIRQELKQKAAEQGIRFNA
ncbi:MAG: hypothetical protein A3F84_15375 [Candidatus Handelsmanbacteria bacterium RIFCSPLOWO2_12_FULL_64_10]|uniref:Initiator Rep protein domain-containing protein n=1 Tax=Handelsmanbacteria sp. (strain RIFCSPLOWO2_12_FULL_64_10) TaxID=1817868 RepID=A0A1F6CCC1_HANXR|nr:MAG: hypothetical protein A3F84_15375 [Candidatus Handelsmanbacteria bacterium RIFCSPLOWO2_12_FULL_64_10]